MASSKNWKWTTNASQLAASIKDRSLVKGMLASSGEAFAQWQAKRKANGEDGPPPEVVAVELFPGWATRRYRAPGTPGGKPQSTEEFSVDVFVAGFATMTKMPETRAQRAFMRLARSYANLPKNPPSTAPEVERQMSRSTEDLLSSVHLPPRPDEITEESELAALDRHYATLDADSQDDAVSTDGSIRSDSTSSASSTSASSSIHSISSATSTSTIGSALDAAYLNARLKPFLSSVAPNRHIRLSIYASPPQPDSEAAVVHAREPDEDHHGPIAVGHVVTSNVGSFQLKMNVPWDKLCKHPGGVYIAYGERTQRYRLHILAEMLPSPDNASAAPLPISVQTTRSVALGEANVRVISDIDDTIKLSNILGGARVVFQNVFCRRLEDVIIPGMAEWYNAMAKRGVDFHYVSNGPFQLLPVINEFLHLTSLPEGSVRLRSYDGRSLFSGIMSDPMTRKRAAVVDVLSSFEQSKFFLVGDSGEQDLELYAALAAERPHQILGVFIRDATTTSSGDDSSSRPLDDPTGSAMVNSFMGKGIVEEPGSIPESLSGSTSPSGSSSNSSSLSDSLTDKHGDGESTLRSPLSTPTATLTPTSSRTKASRMRTWMKRSISAAEYFAPPNTDTPPSSSESASDMARSNSLPDTPTGDGFSFTPNQQLPLNPNSGYAMGALLFRPPSPRSWSALSPMDKRRVELQMRVYKARAMMPENVPLRVFRHASECVEAGEMLDRLHLSGSGSTSPKSS